MPAAAYEELEAPAAAAVCLLEVDEAAVGVRRVDEPSPPWTCSLADPGDVEEAVKLRSVLGRLLHEYALGQRARRAGGEARAHGHGAATGVRRGVLPRLSRREGRHAGTYARFTWSRQDPRERNCAYLYAQRTQFLEVLKD